MRLKVDLMKKSRKNQEWQRAIENALKKKGFSNTAAQKTAAKTIRKSIAKDKLLLNRRRDHSTDWKKTMQVHQVQCNAASRKAAFLHENAAINKPSTMVGKIVIIPPGAILH